MYKNSSIGFDSDDLENHEVKAEKIIRCLQADKEFCHDFFFGTDSRMCNMSQLRSNLLAYLERNYQVVVSRKDFSTIVYETLWSEGSWATLRTYERQSSFYVWLKEVAKMPSWTD